MAQIYTSLLKMRKKYAQVLDFYVKIVPLKAI